MTEGSTRNTILIVAGCGLALLLAVAVVPVIGILAAIAIPNFVAMQLKSKRAEVPGHVDGLKVAELSYQAANSTWVPAGSEEEAQRLVGRELREWEDGPGFAELGWRPEGKVRGAYWVVVHGDDFEVHGICDVDGDGELAEYIATSTRSAQPVTPGDVY